MAASDADASDAGASGPGTIETGPTELALRCRCGAVRGAVEARGGTNRLACYCASCRAFAQHCGGDALDASGGTDLFQTTAGRVRLEGAEHLTALRMTARGPVRWRCRECGTAVATTWPTPLLPYATVPVASLHGRRDLLGPVHGAAFTDGAPAPPLHPSLGTLGMARVMGRFARAMVRARLRGEHRRSPFHADGRPVAEAPVMDPAERERLAALPIGG